mmetsp:Transcript_8087/g.17346  ORF Transcript_8087/g.17346 Transcript_8087/m.17346 type:complete len:242 (-) Transcript_8087:759-1484(-)
MQRAAGPGRPGRGPSGGGDALRHRQALHDPNDAVQLVGRRERRVGGQRLLRGDRGRPHRAVEVAPARHEQGQGRRLRPAHLCAVPGARPPRGVPVPARRRLEEGRAVVRVGHRAARGAHGVDHIAAQELERDHRRHHRPGDHGAHEGHRGQADLRRVWRDQVPLAPAPPEGEEAELGEPAVIPLGLGRADRQLVRPAAVRARVLPLVPHVRAEQLCRRARGLLQGRPPRPRARGARVRGAA